MKYAKICRGDELVHEFTGEERGSVALALHAWALDEYPNGEKCGWAIIKMVSEWTANSDGGNYRVEGVEGDYECFAYGDGGISVELGSR